MYSLEQNQAGHALAILRDNYYVLHLAAGTVRNETHAQQVVDVLNAAEALVDQDGDAEQAALEQAVKRLRGDV
jgi:hypothetical protein